MHINFMLISTTIDVNKQCGPKGLAAFYFIHIHSNILDKKGKTFEDLKSLYLFCHYLYLNEGFLLELTFILQKPISLRK